MDSTAAAVDPEADRTERLALLGLLVTGLAHEVRTPLAAATNHLSILQRRLGGDLPPRLADAPGHVAATLDALDRIDSVVERLRPFAFADGEARLVTRSLDDIATEALEIFLVANPGRLASVGELAHTTPVPLDRLLLEHAVLRLSESLSEGVADPGIRVSTRETPLAVELVLEGPRAHVPPTDGAVRAARRVVEGQGGAVSLRAPAVGRGTIVVLSFPKRATLAEARAP
jgi:signal transduction histidine kinase